MLTSAAPTILSVETDSAWVVIFGVSLVTFFAALLLRRLIARPAGVVSGVFLSLPLVLPIVAAIIFEHEALPEVAVLRPAGDALRQGSSELLHLLFLADSNSKVVTPYALTGTAGSWLLGIGLSVSSFMLLRRAVGAILVHRLVRRCTPVPADALRMVSIEMETLSRSAGLKYVPEILLLPGRAPGAFAVGARRGRILLSRGLITELDPPELTAILAHEMAHLKAHDCQVLFVAGLLRDVVAWNPIAHLSFGRLTTDRELEADRRAAEITGAPLAVASSLLKVCEQVRGSKLRHRAAVAFLRPGARISRRVSHLLTLADGRSAASSPAAMPYLFAALLVALMGLQVGARIAEQDSRAFAIMWGESTSPATDAYDSRSAFRESKRPAVRRGFNKVRPRYYARLASGGAVRQKDVSEWLDAMSVWARQQGQPLVRRRWESRQDWRATPIFSEQVGPFGIYSMQRKPI